MPRSVATGSHYSALLRDVGDLLVRFESLEILPSFRRLMGVLTQPFLRRTPESGECGLAVDVFEQWLETWIDSLGYYFTHFCGAIVRFFAAVLRAPGAVPESLVIHCLALLEFVVHAMTAPQTSRHARPIASALFGVQAYIADIVSNGALRLTRWSGGYSGCCSCNDLFFFFF